VFLFTVIYQGHDRADDAESVAWIAEVEKTIVEAFMYLNINWVLKSIGYVSKDIWNSSSIEKVPKSARALALNSDGS